MFKYNLIVFLVLFCVFQICAAERILQTTDVVEYIRPCARKDPHLNNCIKVAFNHLKPYLVTGIDEIGVPPIDPFKIPYMGMENGNGAVRIKAAFTNMTALGAGNYTIAKVRADISKLRIDLGVKFPRIEVAGKYDVTGQVLLLPVNSKGDFWAAFVDVSAIGRIFGKEVTRNGMKYMNIEKLLIDFKVQKSKFKIKDYINHNNAIGAAMNAFMNNNAKEIIEEMKPAAAQSISQHFKSILNSAFLKIPLDLWLKP